MAHAHTIVKREMRVLTTTAEAVYVLNISFYTARLELIIGPHGVHHIQVTARMRYAITA